MTKRPSSYGEEDQQPHKIIHKNDGPQRVNPYHHLIDMEKADPKLYIKNQILLSALLKKGIKHLFPIQYQTFKPIVQEYDIIARDRTGSGKTLAFTLPVLQKFYNGGLFQKQTHSCKFLIVLPTRQLTLQVKNEIQSLANSSLNSKKWFSVVAAYGGNNIWGQIQEIKRGCDVIVGTPGRLIDLLSKEQIPLQDLKVICLDEADEMLNQGFQLQIERIFQFITKRVQIKPQTLMFSATIPVWIQEMSVKYQNQKKKQYIDLIGDQENVNVTSKTVQHRKINCENLPREKAIRQLISHYIYQNKSIENPRVIIFCQTKRDVNSVGRTYNFGMRAGILHGDVPQSLRQKVFKQFKNGELKCVIATNVAARGLDFPQIALVIQFQPPKFTQSYIHRSGRTGRAGKFGVCVTLYDSSQAKLFYRIQKEAKISIKQLDIINLNLNQKNNIKKDDKKQDQKEDKKENDKKNEMMLFDKKWSGQVTQDQAQQAKKRKQQLQIFIGNIPKQSTDDDLKKFFSQNFIKLVNLKCLKNRQGNSKGIAFALCANDFNLNRALELDKSRFQGRCLKINKTIKKPQLTV